MTTPQAAASSLDARSAELLAHARFEVAKRTDRLFAGLLVAQWIFGIVLAIEVSPRAWAGTESHVHPHIWAALFLELAVIALPIGMVLTGAGRSLNRHVIAVAQMLTSALLIHLTGGRIETHFHIFGSLAFLAFYRDWKVLITATAIVALDHLTRGIYLPLSAYGVATASPWRWLEHASWVLFTDAFLVHSCLKHVREMAENARREASLEFANHELQDSTRMLDQRVRDRTLEFEASNGRLQESLDELHSTQAQLITASRNAGKADVATAVLHNVGNVLNSVNVSATVVRDGLAVSKALNLPKVVGLLETHRSELAAFLTHDEKGKLLPDYLHKLGDAVLAEHAGFAGELTLLQKHIDHIKNIVAMQQANAKDTSGLAELVEIADLLEDALRLGGIDNHLEVIRDYAKMGPAQVDRHKLFQIVVNLIGNALQALQDIGPQRARRLVLITRQLDDCLQISIEDNGCGIEPDLRRKIFNLGFTTKAGGHGFGLHSAACLAKELGGSLKVQSQGRDLGATFTLQIPLLAMRKAS